MAGDDEGRIQNDNKLVVRPDTLITSRWDKRTKSVYKLNKESLKYRSLDIRESPASFGRCQRVEWLRRQWMSSGAAMWQQPATEHAPLVNKYTVQGVVGLVHDRQQFVQGPLCKWYSLALKLNAMHQICFNKSMYVIGVKHNRIYNRV